MITPRVITDSIVEPITLDYLKAHARISHDAEDDVLEVMISAARRYFEQRTGYTIHEKTLEITLDQWPVENYICLPRATPLVGITYVKLKDSDAVETTWSSSDYIADTYSIPGRLVLGYNETWPSFTKYPVAPIRIRYTAGIATTPGGDAPEDIRQCIALIAAHFDCNREAIVIGNNVTIESKRIEMSVDALLQNYMQWGF